MWDTVEAAAMFDEIFQSLSWFLGSVAFITLSLGGVGVMNTMLTSVAERTSENMQACLEKAPQARQYYSDAFPVYDTCRLIVRPDQLSVCAVRAWG